MFQRVAFVSMWALFAASGVNGTTVVTYTLELGGDDHVVQHEAGQSPAFTPGTVSAYPRVVNFCEDGPDLTWAVRVSVSGAINTGDGTGAESFGAANLVFDLELWNADASGTPTTIVSDFGAAEMACQSGTPGVAGALNCAPTGMGFWSEINDGDEDGGVTDILENAAFARSLSQEDPIAQKWTLIDPPAGGVTGYPAGGPGFDYGWYPTANGRGGQDLDRSKPIVAVNDPTLGGKLVGFGAGYTNYFYTNLTAGNGYLPGVGVKDPWGAALENYYFADDPYTWTFGVRSDTEDDRPLFEGQINVSYLPTGTYVLKVVPSAEGTNVLHGDVQWYNQTPNYGSYGSFAKKADTVVASSQAFVILAWDCGPGGVSARKVFYNNSYWDGNNAVIQPGPGSTNHDDDMDAVDPNKQALLPGDGQAQFANWTSYDLGINGLVYEIDNVPAGYTISAADFEFVNQGRLGSGTAVISTATIQAVADTPVAGTTRVFITFPDASAVKNGWLKVTVKTAGLGLVDGDDVSYWGNVRAESGSFGTSIPVDATDELDARVRRTGFFPAGVTNPYDYNRDNRVDATDELDARAHRTGFMPVTRITR